MSTDGLPQLQVNPSNYGRPNIVLTILVLSAQAVYVLANRYNPSF